MLKYEEEINEAINLYADDKLAEFEVMAKNIIERLKKDLTNLKKDKKSDTRKIARIHFTWGFILALNSEYEQSLLQYEDALKNDPKNDDIVWQMVEIFLHHLYKPEPAKKLLEERLLKNSPENENYKDALVLAKMSFDPTETNEININN